MATRITASQAKHPGPYTPLTREQPYKERDHMTIVAVVIGAIALTATVSMVITGYDA